jgi:hypothetical protein
MAGRARTLLDAGVLGERAGSGSVLTEADASSLEGTTGTPALFDGLEKYEPIPMV